MVSGGDTDRILIASMAYLLGRPRGGGGRWRGGGSWVGDGWGSILDRVTKDLKTGGWGGGVRALLGMALGINELDNQLAGSESV